MPRHVRNILIAVLLATLALIAGINGYVHHQFKTNIDNTLSKISPFVQVKYSDLSTEIMSSKVILDNVRISADFLPETVNLGKLTFETPGMLYMINGPDSMKKGDFPHHLGFAIKDFYFELHSETAKWLDRIVARLNYVYASERTLCAGKSILGPKDLREMGYTRIGSDLRIAYDYNESKKTLNIDLNSKTREMGSIVSNIKVTNLGGMSSDRFMQSGLPQLANVSVTYKDDTYTPRYVKYCAEQSKMTKEKFIEAEAKQSDNYFYMTWGFAPGFGLRDAYRDFLLKPDLVTMTMTPGEGFNPLLLPRMSSSEILEALRTHLKINGLLVTDLSFKLPPPGFMEDFDKKLADALDFDALLRGDPVKPPPKIVKKKVEVKLPAQYHVIKLANASKYIPNFVRITLKNGSERSGQLLRVDADNLYVQKKVSGGKFTMTVAKSKIKKIESYFSKTVMKQEQ